MTQPLIQRGSILAALASEEECALLRRILSGSGWALCFAPTFQEAQALLPASSFGVVICAGNLGDGHGWKEVLNEVRRMPVPPPFIVADRLADEVLWAEALNLGCHDLLMTPFREEEVLRVLPMAWDSWIRELERAAAGCKPPKAAEPAGPAGPEGLSFSRALANGAD